MEKQIYSGNNSYHVKVVTSPEEMIHVIAIRSICFMEETGLSAKQAHDGNDYQATHVIMYCGDEPIASLRIRWFKDFAKIERTALRKAYRNSNALRALGDFVFAHIARKGYDVAITHANPLLARLWRTLFGFKESANKPRLRFAGHATDYVELVKVLSVPVDAIGIETPASVLMRIEGSWDVPSEFEPLS
jgi:hypothetical protein